ncbi:type I restriction-modification system (plasmid) [Geminocystis sp. NIES-3708]|uniref:restriction endonuclease subunit S n=1 Tax=Geminocystis sp. NIES-3708 TaxID=1615909 RepID=UPI0005FC8F66|nr:restriction endonuclease subunit S [Geminocystis sp. NIES-3708]BAQ63203.1 type I restriction-modification system [Geminocystis sp. NIES-3708]
MTLPEGWQIKTLEELSEKITKGTTPTSIGFQFTNEGINFIKVETISSNGQFINSKLAYINSDCHEALKRSQLHKGDILFSIAGALGRTAIVTSKILPANTNQALAIIRLKSSDKIDKNFILIALSSGFLLEQIEKNRGGVAQQNLSLTQIKSFQIPIPPIEVQKRIVEILDEAFEGIDRAIALTKQNLLNARELFNSYLNNIFTNKGDDWVEKKLGDIANIYYGYTAKASQEPKGKKFLRITDIQNNKVDWTTVPYCDISDEDYVKHKLRTGDIVFARTGATTGKSFLVKNPPEAVSASYLIRLSIKKIDIIPEFLILFFQTNEYWNLINLGISGSAQGGFNASKLKTLNIPIPLKNSIQLNIINKLNKLSAEVARLEEIYQKKIELLEELKQSILERAFRGELTANK